MKRLSTIASALVLSFAAPFARADVGPPIAFRLPTSNLQPVDPHMEYAGRFEIQVGADGVLNGVTLSGTGWIIKNSDFSGPRHVKAGDIIPIAFIASAANPAEPLQIGATFNDIPASARFDLSPRRFERLKHKLPLRRIDAPAVAIPPPLADAPAPRGGAIHLHCVGRFVCTRTDGAIIGGDAVKFRIMDDDSPAADEIMYEGYTTRNGDFDVQFDWDDCDAIGCDDPDIYIEFETANSIVTTKDSNGTLYSWSGESNTLADFTGTFVNFGLLSPSYNQDAAVHINNSIVRTHRYIQDAVGINVPHVDAMWADDSRGGTGAWYTPGLALIHVSTGEQWIEGTHHHEFGHHFMQTQAINTTPNYCNCDSSPTNCGHCVWCAENPTDAFNEGFPDWLGSAVSRAYPAEYGITAFSINDSRYTLESVMTCSCGTPDNAQNTEGFVGALLRDIEDDTQDDSTGPGDCAQDVLALGPAPILSTVAFDDPTNLAAFIADFRTRFPQYDQDFYSTATNVSATYAFGPPNPVVLSQSQGCRVNRAGDPLTLTVSANGALLHYRWRRNGINLSDDFHISGATTPNLTLNPLSANDTGSYDCVVLTCDESRSTNSQPVSVRVFGGSAGPAVAWGANQSGQCGNGTQNNPSPPASVNGLADALAIEGNHFQLTALRPDGTVWCAGYNGYGGIGDPNPAHQYVLTPQQVPDLSDVAQVRSGGATNYAIKRNGSLWAWGYNAYGQVGDGTWNNSRSAPNAVQNLNCVVDVGSSFYHAVAVQSDGTVWTWGIGNAGQLGDGPINTFRFLPAPVPGLTGAVSIATSDSHVLALKSDGTVWAWGAASAGQLGIGPNPPGYQYTPAQVLGLSNVVAIATPPDTPRSYAITSNGRVWVWGQDAFGALGNGGNGGNIYAPQQLTSLANVQAIRATSFDMFAINGDGAIWASGSSDYGLLGTNVPNGTYWFFPQPLPFVATPAGLGSGPYTIWALGSIVPLPHDGNVNGDLAVNGADLQPFVAGVVQALPATGNFARADFNSNGILDASDIPGMITVLLGP